MLTNLLFFTAMILLSLIISRAGRPRQTLKPVPIRNQAVPVRPLPDLPGR